jgi:hypothetical protein
MTLNGYGFDAFKMFAAAGPVAGFAAVAHVRATRRRKLALKSESAARCSRSVFVDVPGSGTWPAASVRFDLTPQLQGWLAAANSGSLAGIDTPDAVMLAFDLDATWKGVAHADRHADTVHQSQLVATRELFVVRSVDAGCASTGISLREMLEAHRTLPEGDPLYCTEEGRIQAKPVRRLRAPAFKEARQFYWVRADAVAAQSRRRRT